MGTLSFIYLRLNSPIVPQSYDYSPMYYPVLFPGRCTARLKSNGSFHFKQTSLNVQIPSGLHDVP